jgi:DNA-binding CsgD family transcriptional regulator
MTDFDKAKTYGDWLAAVGPAITGLGTDDFFPQLEVAMAVIPDIGCAMLLHYPNNGQPEALHTSYARGEEYRLHVEGYLSGPYVLDPYYLASINGIKAGAYMLQEVAPDNFKKSEYYRVYYRATGLKDELNYLQPIPEGGYLHLSLAYQGNSARIPAVTGRLLKSIAPVVNALLLRHWQWCVPQSPAREDEGIHGQVVQALGLFGSSLLTEREQSILQLVLQGHSNRSVSMKLDIAESTVKLHRKHIYEKFDISSQSELFHLFIDSISCFDPQKNVDPLQSYLGQ